jgi:hypothetical protein
MKAGHLVKTGTAHRPAHPSPYNIMENRESHSKMEVEIGVMHLQAKEHQA